MTRTFTMQQAARVALTHTVVIYRAIRAGVLHATQTPDGTDWLVEERCLAAWLDRRVCACRELAKRLPTEGEGVDVQR